MYYVSDYDKVLNEVIVKLKELDINFSKSYSDGRINSIFNEEKIVKILLNSQKEINILKEYDVKIYEQPKPRFWYDIVIKNTDNSFFLPLNIKITNPNLKSASNISSKTGLYFALTGDIYPNFSNTWGNYFYKLAKNLKATQTDYYLLVFNKNNPNDIFFTSLKRMQSLIPNGNNLPFQFNPNLNRKLVNRTYAQSKEFLLNILFQSVKKRAKILDDFNDNFKN
ncbi:hypothetical protein ACXYRP_00605 [Mycoplasma sp. 5912]